MRTDTGKYTGRIARRRPTGIAEVRARLTGLQVNPRLAPFVRREIEEADALVLRAERYAANGDEADDLVAAARVKVERTIDVARMRYGSALGGRRYYHDH